MVTILRQGELVLYSHTAWAEDADGGGFSLTESEDALYIGSYIDSLEAESEDPEKYTLNPVVVTSLTLTWQAAGAPDHGHATTFGLFVNAFGNFTAALYVVFAFLTFTTTVPLWRLRNPTLLLESIERAELNFAVAADAAEAAASDISVFRFSAESGVPSSITSPSALVSVNGPVWFPFSSVR